MITERLFFTKTKDIKYISHLDVYRTFQRAIARSGLPVWYTEGFNQHMYLSFPVALSLGYESIYEVAEIKLPEHIDGLADIINPLLPHGLRVFANAEAKYDANEIAFAKYFIELGDNEVPAEDIKNAWDGLMSQEQIIVSKKNKKGVYKDKDIKLDVFESRSRIDGEHVLVDVVVSAGNFASLNPQMLLDYMFQNKLGRELEHYQIKRTQILMKNHELFE